MAASLATSSCWGRASVVSRCAGVQNCTAQAQSQPMRVARRRSGVAAPTRPIRPPHRCSRSLSLGIRLASHGWIRSCGYGSGRAGIDSDSGGVEARASA